MTFIAQRKNTYGPPQSLKGINLLFRLSRNLCPAQLDFEILEEKQFDYGM
jgi:hypothetical protein